MPKYLVERHLPGLTGDQLSAAADRARQATAAMSEAGTPVRYLGSTYVPGEEKCFCLFESATAEIVKEANGRAELPDREALDLSP